MTRAAATRLRAGLGELDGVAEVRGRGLMVGVTLADGLDAAAIAARALELRASSSTSRASGCCAFCRRW